MEHDGGPSAQVAATGDAQPWAAAILALAGIGLVLLFVVLPHSLLGDGYVRYRKLTALLSDGTLVRDRFSYIGPLFAAPLWLLPGARDWWFERYNVLVLAAGVAAAWRVLRPVVTREERATAAVLLVGTGMMPSATHDFYGEMFSAIMTGTGLLLLTTGRSRPGWLAVVLGVANTPATAIGLLLVAVWRVWRSRRFDGAAALALATTLILLENIIVRGALLDAGYAGDRGAITVMPYSGMAGFSYPFILGLLSLLFSFGKGLLFFAPGLLLVVHARRVRPALAPFLDLSVLFIAGLLLVYSRWWAWYGGWTWGPRFLLFAAYPSAFALAIALRTPGAWARSTVVVAITAWTTWVGVSGAVFGLDGLDVCNANGYALEHLCWYVPDYSPLLHPLVLPPAALSLSQEVWMIFAAIVAAMLLTSGPALGSIADEMRAAVLAGVRHRKSGG